MNVLAVDVGGIRVDASLRTSHPDIYAAGYAANFYNPLEEDSHGKQWECQWIALRTPRPIGPNRDLDLPAH